MTSWWLSGIFLVAGFALLYWAGRFLQTATSEVPYFESPEFTYGLWLLTLVASGLVFGLAVLAAQRRPSRLRWGGLLWVAIPLALLVYFYLYLLGVSLPSVGERVTTFLFSPGTQTACALLVGYFVAAALAPLVLPSGRRH